MHVVRDLVVVSKVSGVGSARGGQRPSGLDGSASVRSHVWAEACCSGVSSRRERTACCSQALTPRGPDTWFKPPAGGFPFGTRQQSSAERQVAGCPLGPGQLVC